MEPTLHCEPDGSYTVSMNVRLEGSLLEQEEQIAAHVNTLGNYLTGKALQNLDTDGSPIVRHNVKLTSKGQQKKTTRHPTAKLP